MSNNSYLLDKSLCHRCGACFYCDTDGILDKDSRGYPLIAQKYNDSQINLLAGCSGRAFDMPAHYKLIYRYKEDYDWKSPDIGLIKKAGIAYSNVDNIRTIGQSGGVITTLALGALTMGLIKSLLCVKRSDTNPFEADYLIAHNKDELLKAVRSKYVICSPLKGLKDIKTENLPFGAVLLPCQAQSLQLLKENDEFISKNLKCIIGPFCGFNLEKEAGEQFARLVKINKNKVVRFENRGGHFPGITKITTNDNEYHIDRKFHKILYRIFVPTRCYTCVDYTNEFADISVGDAFIYNNNDLVYPDGAAWVLLRSEVGQQIVDYCVEQNLLTVIPQDIEYTQKYWRNGMIYRKVRAYNRVLRYKKRGVKVPDYSVTHSYLKQYTGVDRQFDLTVRFLRLPLIKNLCLRFYYSLCISNNPRMKKMYNFLGKRAFTHHDDAFPQSTVSNCLSYMKNLIKKIPGLVKFGIFFGFVTPKPKEQKRIIISGGYGYRNVGDEAQLAFNLAYLRKNYPDYKITVLTPNTEYTAQQHNVDVELAPRVVFYHADSSKHYGKSDLIFKIRYFLKLPRLALNARLTYARLPLLFVHPEEARLLSAIRDSSLLLLSGGGYLTGKTLSRLWDNVLLIKLAHTMRVPAIASGQTIGVFNDWMSKLLAKWGLSILLYITVRDNLDSIADLKSIGIHGEHVSATIDDALFCDVASKQHMHELLSQNNIPDDKPYVVINAHYWKQSQHITDKLIERLTILCDKLCAEKNVNIVFLPMHPTDEKAAHDVIERMSNNAYLFKYEYNYSEARGLIKYSACCITMKHHPIVFACGEGLPVISIVADEYYYHKNKGALALFNQEKYLVRVNDTFDAEIIQLFDEINTNYKTVKQEIEKHVKKYESLAGKAIRDFFKNQYNMRG